jgi:hypothetical protein
MKLTVVGHRKISPGKPSISFLPAESMEQARRILAEFQNRPNMDYGYIWDHETRKTAGEFETTLGAGFAKS